MVVEARSRLGWIAVLAIAGVFVAVWLGWLAFRVAGSVPASSGGVHVYEVVETRLGRATIGCGGALTTTCNGEAGIYFDKCDERYYRYFEPINAHPERVDALIGDLLGKRPPREGRWVAAVCGNPD